MKFIPQAEEELNSFSLINEGQYLFEVIHSKDAISKSGNEMIEIQLKVWDDAGKEHIVFDYLLEQMAYKLKHFCDATGLFSKYESGELNSLDCLGRCGKVHIIIQQGKEKPTGGYYPDKNSVKDYIFEPKEEKKKDEKFIDSDIPF